MLYGTLLGLGPVALLIFLYMINPSGLLAADGISTAAGLFLLISPLWPMTYMYAVYRHDLATFEFRANRLLGIYGFLALNLSAFLIFFQFAFEIWKRFNEDPVVFSLFATSLFVILAPAPLSTVPAFRRPPRLRHQVPANRSGQCLRSENPDCPRSQHSARHPGGRGSAHLDDPPVSTVHLRPHPSGGALPPKRGHRDRQRGRPARVAAFKPPVHQLRQ